MAAISQKIGNLIGGVSQQPDSLKFNGQLRVCDNYYPDVTLGLAKRPGLKGISKLANAVDDVTLTKPVVNKLVEDPVMVLLAGIMCDNITKAC